MKFVSWFREKLVVELSSGEQQTFVVSPNHRVTKDGLDCLSADLKPGDPVELEKNDDTEEVTLIAATTAPPE